MRLQIIEDDDRTYSEIIGSGSKWQNKNEIVANYCIIDNERKWEENNESKNIKRRLQK